MTDIAGNEISPGCVILYAACLTRMESIHNPLDLLDDPCNTLPRLQTKTTSRCYE